MQSWIEVHCYLIAALSYRNRLHSMAVIIENTINASCWRPRKLSYSNDCHKLSWSRMWQQHNLHQGRTVNYVSSHMQVVRCWPLATSAGDVSFHHIVQALRAVVEVVVCLKLGWWHMVWRYMSCCICIMRLCSIGVDGDLAVCECGNAW